LTDSHKKHITISEGATSFTKDYLGLPVIDKDGVKVGKVADLAVKMGEEFPGVSSVAVLVKIRVSLLGSARFEAIIPWKAVKAVDDDRIVLKIAYSEIKPGKLEKSELLFNRHVMDQQIVDNEGRRLLRVNDVKLRAVGDALVLVGVEVGIKGLLYRLGAGRRLERVARMMNLKIMENIIMWDLVEQFDDQMKQIKLSVSQEMLKDLMNL
jgi:sporulation protein YlmC with PRC-barrel domain